MPILSPLAHRIQGEFLEMPGLRLTPPQAQRLWGLDPVTCTAVIDTLIDAAFLIRTPDGTVGRPVGETMRLRLRSKP